MIDSPTENVKMTFEQMQQLDAFNKQLANYQSEISNSLRNLKATQLECDRAVKQQAYLEEQVANLESDIELKKTEKETISNEITDAKTTLDEINSKIKSQTEKHESKLAELNQREKDIQVKEDNLQRKVEDFNSKSSQLLEDQSSIKTAKEAFLKATETVIW